MRKLAIFAVVVSLLAVGWAQQQQPAQAKAKPEDPQTVRAFEDRLDQYVALRDKLGGGSHKVQESAADVKARQEALATKLKTARGGAKHGDIFDEEIAEYFKRELRAKFHGPAGHRMRLSMAHAEPLPKLHLTANEVYPENLPLQSTPPTLLLNLPPLPKDIQYRFAGRDLILYDAETNLIVDYIHEALPTY